MTLDIKGVERKRADLDKALKNGDPSTTIISLLTELRNGVVPSDKLLRDTKIGVQVNRLKMHKDPQVAKLASEMVSRWKAEMQKQKQGTSGASTPKPAANGASASPRAAATASPVPVKAEKKKYPGDVAKRNVKVDGMDDKANCTGNASRDGCVKLMYNGIAFMSDELPEDILRVAREVELAAFQSFKSTVSKPYTDKCRSLFSNLKNASNTKLRQRVYNGDIAPQRFVTMTHEELKSEERKAEDQKLMKENMDKAMVAQEEKSVSTALTCGKCGQMKVSYTQAQTRSADEPMTTFCECLHCGNRWKFS